MLSEFEKKIADFVKANDSFGSADKILLAVSGGADSTALLYAMRALKSEGVLSGDYLCAHINHQLRGAEAQRDEDFAAAQADGLNLPITTRRVDVRGFARENKLSIETAARKLRIDSLLDIAKANNCSAIATAHHKDDNAETVLQRLVRGTGFRGLGGIWPVRVLAGEIRLVRPLLCVTRRQIIDYLENRNLKWRKDRTNDDCAYRRNYIRHRLIPALQQQCSGSVAEQLFELSQSARRFYSLVCSCAEKVWPKLADSSGNSLKLDLNNFLTQPVPVRIELVRRGLVEIGSGEKNLTQQHYERILKLTKQNISGRKIELPDGFIVRREYGNLIFTSLEKDRRPKEGKDESIALEIPGRRQFGGCLIEASVLEPVQGGFEKFKAEKNEYVEWFDLEKVKPPLTVAFRREGDRFWPLGLASEKRVGKFLTAAKVPQELRKKILIVADSEKIIWVWPIRISEQAKITGETQKILQLQINDSG